MVRPGKIVPGSAEAHALELRRAEALELRVKGLLTMKEIGQRLGVSKTTALNYVHHEIDAELKDHDKNVEQGRHLEDARLDEWLKKTMVALEQEGDVDKAVKLLGIALKISERRAKLLGLDAPTKQEVTGKDGAPVAGPIIYIPPEVQDSP